MRARRELRRLWLLLRIETRTRRSAPLRGGARGDLRRTREALWRGGCKGWGWPGWAAAAVLWLCGWGGMC